MYPSSVRSQSAPNGTFAEWAAKAAAARDAGRPAEAIEAYRHAAALRPSWEEGWWYLGTLNYDTEHFADGEKALRKVVELDPRLGPAWAFLGLCEFETGQYRASLTHLQRARGLGFAQNPEVQKVALYHLGLLLNLNSEFEKSTEVLTSEFAASNFPDQIKMAMGLALLRIPLLPNQVDPAKDGLLHAAGETAALLANHKDAQAFESFEQMLAAYAGAPYLHYAYGMALVAAGRYKDAESQFRQEAEVTSSGAEAWIGLTTVFLKEGRRPDGEAAAHHAVRLNPRLAATFDAVELALRLPQNGAGGSAVPPQVGKLADGSIPPDAMQVKRYALSRAADSTARNASSELANKEPSNGNFDELARRAEAAQSAGNLSESDRLYRAGLELRPEWAQGWRMAGTFAYMKGQLPEAITALKRAVTLDPKPPEGWTVLGLAEFQTKDYTNALLHLQRGRGGGFGGNRAAIQVAEYHLAILLNLNGEFDQALDLLIPEVGAGPPSEDVQFAMGIALLRMAMLPEQISGAQRSLVSSAGRAAALLSESRYDQAFPIFDQLIREHPETPFLHFAYGAALASSSNYDRARSQLLEEARLNPSSFLPYARLASISLVLHAPEEALQFARKAVAIAPESAESHYMLGRSLLEMGDAAGAAGALEAARRLAPGSPEVHFNLARAYSKMHRPQDADRERAEFERLQAENPLNPTGVMGAPQPHAHDPVAGTDSSQSHPQ